MQERQTDPDHTRRRFLYSATATGIAALAGCTSDDGSADRAGGDDPADATPTAGASESTEAPDGGSTSEIDSDVFAEFSWDRRTLVVTVADPKPVSEIEMRSAGDVFASAYVGRLDDIEVVEIEQNFDDQTYTFVALDHDGNEIDSVEKTFTTDVGIQRLQSKATANGNTDRSRAFIEENQDQYQNFVVTLENRGNAPGIIEGEMWMTDGAPEVKDGRPDWKDYHNYIAVPPDETTTVGRIAGGCVFRDTTVKDWPESIMNVRDEFPDDYKNGGFTVEASLGWKAGRGGTEYEAAIDIQYGELVKVSDYSTDVWVPRTVTSEFDR